MDISLLRALSLALGLGLLIGWQRERAGSRFGGIRTFPIIALLGAILGHLTQRWGGLVIAAGFICITALLALAHWGKEPDADDMGQTTESAALLTFALGALLTTEHYAAALVVGGVTAVLLYFKEAMHHFAGTMSERDAEAVIRFVIITLIILPLVPDRFYGPYQVLNPREIWLMVVLIVTIGLIGYVSYRLFRGQASTALAGVLGGLISSTATTVSYARRVHGSTQGLVIAAVIIGIAWTVSVTRVILEVVAVAPGIVPKVVPPLFVLLIVMATTCWAMWYFNRGGSAEMPEQDNPAELKSALFFGVLYGAVILAAAAAKDYFGGQGLFVVAVISGIVDVDAITLSTAQLGASGRLDTETVWEVVLLASLSNILFKSGMVLIIGSRRLFMYVAPLCGLSLGTGAALFWLWPAAV